MLDADFSLVHELWIAGAMVCATVIMHVIGLDLLHDLTHWHVRRWIRLVHINRIVVPLGVVLGLFALHGLEIWLYALVYLRLGLFPGMEEALYFSTSSYGTLGAADIVPPDWRVFGALEAVNGMLLIGWSTAFLFATLSHLTWRDDEEAPYALPRGAMARRSPRPSGSRSVSPSSTNSSDTELMQ